MMAPKGVACSTAEALSCLTGVVLGAGECMAWQGRGDDGSISLLIPTVDVFGALGLDLWFRCWHHWH